MLNCTDTECILHHQHYYEHLHQLQQMQHHLQDHREHHAMSGEPGERELGDNNFVNETGDSDVAGLSHLDAPSDSVYIVCGVLIAMVLVAAIIILLAVFISKLRKRDENNRHSTVNHRHPQDRVILHSASQQQNNVNNNQVHVNNNNNINNGSTIPPAAANGGTTISTVSATVINPPLLQSTPSAEDTPACPPRQFIWQIPATHPYAMYNNDKETLVHTLPSEQPGFCRGFRKNLQGRWKRLVKRKPVNEAYTIPPELRDQLKNIYVY